MPDLQETTAASPQNDPGDAPRPVKFRGAGFTPQPLDPCRVPHREVEHRFNQRAGCGITVGERLEHVGFRHEADGMVQCRVPGRKTRHVQHVRDAVARRVAQ